MGTVARASGKSRDPHACPSFQQRAVHRKVVGRKPLLPCLLHHLRQELLGHLGFQQSVTRQSCVSSNSMRKDGVCTR